MAVIKSKVDVKSSQFKENYEHYQTVLQKHKEILDDVRAGHPKAMEKHIDRGKMPARQRIKEILDPEAVIPGEGDYPEEKGFWHKEDNLLVAMKDTKGDVIGIISVDDSKSGKIPTEDTVKPLEIFANLISEIIQRKKLSKIISESEKRYPFSCLKSLNSPTQSDTKSCKCFASIYNCIASAL